MDAWSLLRRRVTANGGAPFVTHVDPDTGARTELSATSVANAAAKIANALRQEFDLEPGDVVAVDLPVHWQRTTWSAGIWTAGAVISLGPHPAARLIVTSFAAGTTALAALAEESAGVPVVVVSLHPFGLPVTEPLPAGVDDVTITVRQQPDAYLFETPDGSAAAFVDGPEFLSQDEVLAQAGSLATRWGLAEGGRLLAAPALDGWPGWAAAFAVPLVAQASVVLLSGREDAETIASVSQAERTTATAR